MTSDGHVCTACTNWIMARKTLYDGGEEVINWKAPDGLGCCKILNVNTEPDFGCARFMALGQAEEIPHVEILACKIGAPWQHSHAGPCPDCTQHPGTDAAAARACARCQGTGKVRYYDDGYVGEERTRLHPKEKPASTFCAKCAHRIENLDWKICPHCGAKLDAVAAVEQVEFKQ